MDKHVLANAKADAAQGLSSAKTDRKSRSRRKNEQAMFAITLFLWVGLLLGGYLLAHQYIQNSQAYIEQRIKEVEMGNSRHMKALEQNLQGIHNELSAIQTELDTLKEDLALAGETLQGTDKTKQTLEQRIQELNAQLTALKGSLKKLEDAARAW